MAHKVADPTVKPHPPGDGWTHNTHIIAGGEVVPVIEREEEEVGEDERPASEREEIRCHPCRNKLRQRERERRREERKRGSHGVIEEGRKGGREGEEQ